MSTLQAFDSSKVSFYEKSVANGESALLLLQEQKGVEYLTLHLGKKTFPIERFSTEQSVLIPVSYYTKESALHPKLFYKEHGVEKFEVLTLLVHDGAYEKEEIHVSSKKVNPQEKKVQKRIAAEYKEAMQLYATLTPHNYITKPFILPIESKITSAFGKARVYNNTLKGYHSGTDFRAKVGSKVLAANDGVVVLVKERFYSGGTVLLDHGKGVYTCYFHLSAFHVKEGEKVQRGQVIGLSGESGRITGPHLHFSARINAVQVNPLQLINIINKNFFKESVQ